MKTQEYIDFIEWCNQCGLKPHYAKVLKLYVAIMQIGRRS